MKKLSDSEVYKTINALLLFFLVLFYFTENKIFILVAAWLLINDIIYFKLNRVISTYWLQFSEAMGKVMSKVILSIVFYVFLTPIAILFRVFNKSAVDNFLANNKDSYFEDSKTDYSKESFLKSW